MLDRQSSTDAPGGRGAEPQRKLGAAAALKALWPPDLQLAERPRRRKLSAEYKLAILAEAELAKAPKVIEVQGNVFALSEAMLGDGSASSTGQ